MLYPLERAIFYGTVVDDDDDYTQIYDSVYRINPC